MAFAFVPFTHEHLEEAAAMAAARYAAERGRNPAWPQRFEDPAAILPRLRGMIEQAPGAAALHEGRLVGFLLAYLFMHRGERMAYSPDFGHGADPDSRWDIYRGLYAALSPAWLRLGCFLHAVTLFAQEREAHEAWVSLEFGMLTIDALRDMRPVQGARDEVEIRRLRPEEIDVLAPLELGLKRHLASPPTFVALLIDDGRASRAEWLANPDHALWIASLAGEAVGWMCLEPSKAPVLPVADRGTVACTGAYTLPEARGRGIGLALLAHGLAWAREQGYARCSVDFETANLPAMAFWLGRGFQPVCYSFQRRVDPRLAWAGADRDEADVLRAWAGSSSIG
jgi:GNAT superfamily N-acetyltransferase